MGRYATATSIQNKSRKKNRITTNRYGQLKNICFSTNTK